MAGHPDISRRRRFQLVLDVEDYALLEELAERNHRTVTGEIRLAVGDRLKDFGLRAERKEAA